MEDNNSLLLLLYKDNEEFKTSFESHVMKIAIVGDRSIF